MTGSTCEKAVGHARHIDRDLDLADLGEGVVIARMVVERLGARRRGEIIGRKPVLAQHDRIGRDRADMLDETREVKGGLRVSRLIIPVRRGDRAGLAELVDFDHPRRDRATRRMPDEAAGETAREEERTEKGEAPVLRLHPRRPEGQSSAVNLGPENASAIIKGSMISAQARFDNGQLRASFLTTDDGKERSAAVHHRYAGEPGGHAGC